jgi:hypothetical protein
MLILLDLTWFGQKFFKKRIFSEVQDILTQLLPSFKFRITDNPEIMNLAIERVKKALTGGKNENSNNPSSINDGTVQNKQGVRPGTGSEEPNGVQPSAGPSEEKQPDAQESVRSDSSQNDPEEK